VTSERRADDQNNTVAFVFAAEGEALAFYKKVAHRSRYASTSTSHSLINQGAS
jgi:hypothetical protein